MSPDNAAAWLDTRPGRLELGPAPYPTPGPSQLVVRDAAVAVNSVDWIIQTSRAPVYFWIKNSAVIGYDVAGEVVAAALKDRPVAGAMSREPVQLNPASQS